MSGCGLISYVALTSVREFFTGDFTLLAGAANVYDTMEEWFVSFPLLLVISIKLTPGKTIVDHIMSSWYSHKMKQK